MTQLPRLATDDDDWVMDEGGAGGSVLSRSADRSGGSDKAGAEAEARRRTLRAPGSLVSLDPDEDEAPILSARAREDMASWFTTEQLDRARFLLDPARASISASGPLDETLARILLYLDESGLSLMRPDETARPDEAEMRRRLDWVLSNIDWMGPFGRYINLPNVANLQINAEGAPLIVEYRNGTKEEMQRVRLSYEWVSYLVGIWLGERKAMLENSQHRTLYGSIGRARWTFFGRRFAADGFTFQLRLPLPSPSLQDLVDQDSMSPEAARWLRSLVQARMNILISGGSSSGKTTLANALLATIEPMERIGVIEVIAELNTEGRPGTVRYEIGPGDETGLLEVLHGNLFNSLSRLVLGEARGGEVGHLLQAVSSGVSGCIATIHASSALHAAARLAQCAQQGSAFSRLPTSEVYKFIAGLNFFIVQTECVAQGQGHIRRVREILLVADVMDTTFKAHRLFAISEGDNRLTFQEPMLPSAMLARLADFDCPLPSRTGGKAGGLFKTPRR